MRPNVLVAKYPVTTFSFFPGIDWGEKPLPPPPPPKPEDSSPSTGSVGKLKLSSELKEKLVAVTGGETSRKNSVKSTGSRKSDDSSENVGKLEEKKKLLIEQKLGAGKN